MTARKPLDVLRTLNVTSSKWDLLAVSAIALVVGIWAAVAGDSFSMRTVLACEALFLGFYFAGSLFAGSRSLSAGILFDLPLRLLLGYCVMNTALLVLAWVSPLGILVNFGILFAIAATLFFVSRTGEPHRPDPASFCVVAVGLAAATLWCRDSIDPIADHGNTVVFKPWVDGFYHAVHVRIFAESHGASTIEDFRMAGVPARPYHYGVYMLPAFVKQAAAIHSYTAFAGILVPVGTFFTGLAAYAFFGSMWGAWPGLAAAAALLLMPSGAQQGMQNPFMSYQWLTQISPSASYGLALLAVAWLFVIQGCKQGHRGQLLLGWGIAATGVAYKLHYVVASGLLLLLVPALFFQARLRLRARALLALGAFAVYGLAVALVRRVPDAPLIRFDGSAVGEILRLIQTFAMPGPLKEFIVSRTGTTLPWWSNLAVGVPYVLLATLGIFLPLLLVLAFVLRKRLPLVDVVFPLLLVANFLIMFFGLALDFESSTPDELSHRPVIIVHFFVVAWVGGALAWLLVESERLKSKTRPIILGLAVAAMAVPAWFGAGVQRMWAMPRLCPIPVPLALVRVAEFIRSNGGSDDVFQDSQFDRNYAIAALTERRTFIAHTMTRMPFRGEMVATRTTAIDHLMALRQSKMVIARAQVFGFRWFVLHQGDKVDWPAELANRPVFAMGPLKLYEF